jgi:phage shock protein C
MFTSIQHSFRSQGLVRTRDGRVLGGVLSGIGRRMGMDPWRTRLLFILVLLLIPGSQFLVYPILWILMPEESDVMVPAANPLRS